MVTTASRVAAFFTASLFGATALAHAQAQPARQGTPAPPVQLGALAPANLAKPRPKAPFDLTGTWQHDGRWSTGRFVPETFKLTPQAQVRLPTLLAAPPPAALQRGPRPRRRQQGTGLRPPECGRPCVRAAAVHLSHTKNL